MTLSSGSDVPTGIICMWSGAVADIPQGWFLCNGSNGTPNLADRFVIHADADSGGIRDVGDTGGSHTTNLQHNHGGATGGVSFGGGGSNTAGVLDTKHTHSISNALSTSQATIPKFYALAYIMKS